MKGAFLELVVKITGSLNSPDVTKKNLKRQNPLRTQESAQHTSQTDKTVSKSRSVNVFLETVMDHAELRLLGMLCQSLKGQQQLRNVQKYISNICRQHFMIFL